MPAGYERINARRSQPNSRIVFIKPLLGPDEAIATDFLERIAAQCFPVMRDNGIYVTSLEQYEFNREFVGRNFNAGEVIQLVLKARSGHWLPFDYVQMVMMHELAHCKQMNHSKAFWAVRNGYAEEMRKMWVKGYTGEGLWGRGTLLATGAFERNTVRPDEPLPEHLCGGTYSSRKRRRKRGTSSGSQKPTSEERRAQKEKRILKKFGPGGQALGADEGKKATLEAGKGKGKATAKTSKPRVASSNRGRELRAAAAVARFDQVKKEEKGTKVEAVSEDDDETASEADSDEEEDADLIMVDVNGNKLIDGKGRGMVKVCGDEGKDDQDSKDELRELQRFRSFGLQRIQPSTATGKTSPSSSATSCSLSPSLGVAKQSTSNGTNINRESQQRTQKQPASGNDSAKAGGRKQADIKKAAAKPGNSSNSNTSGRKITIADRLVATRPAPKASSSFGNSDTNYNSNSSSAAGVRSFSNIKDKRPAETSTLSGRSGPKPSTDGEHLSAGNVLSTSNSSKNHPAQQAPPPDTNSIKKDTSASTNQCPICSFANEGVPVTCSICSHVLRPSFAGTWRCRSDACTRQESKYLNAGDYGQCGVCGVTRPSDVVLDLTGA